MSPGVADDKPIILLLNGGFAGRFATIAEAQKMADHPFQRGSARVRDERDGRELYRTLDWRQQVRWRPKLSTWPRHTPHDGGPEAA